VRRIDTEVLVIGGGATGAGIARDLSMRGFKVVLVERSDWASGTTGRYNGLMHSGSRYSLKDIHTARECIQENRILRRIMPGCIENTGGYVVATPSDDPAFGDHLIGCCRQAGIPIEDVPVAKVLREEPFVNRGIRRALRVPDATADSFLATRVNVKSAQQYGARAWTYHEVVQLLVANGRVTGTVCRDLVKDELVTIAADLVVNAAGAWAGQVAAMAGVHVPIVCSKGSMIAAHQRVVNSAITRLRWPSECDSVLPSHSVSVLGCTDVIVDGPDHFQPDPAELRLILQECSQLVPIARDMRKLRVWTGVRPLYQTAPVNGASGQELSRTHVILDHEVTDGIAGMLSIVGGKWTTYRLMAEQVADRVCQKLGSPRLCRTHLEPLPGAEEQHYHRLSARLACVEEAAAADQLVCECELVPHSEVEHALVEEETRTLDDVRRTTRLGMGTCQGGFCTYRVAGLYHDLRHPPVEETNAVLQDFIQERWKGFLPIASGDQLRQMRLNELIFSSVLNIAQLCATHGLQESIGS
jgi:glycerol-3-phosphate dehydrogenase